MKHMEIIEKAIIEGKTALTEAQAKQVLKEFGIPVVEEQTFESVDELKRNSSRVTYPAVLKGLGSRLTHKTERAGHII